MVSGMFEEVTELNIFEPSDNLQADNTKEV
jgi:hypothetical protein